MTETPELGRYGVWRGEAGLTPELAVTIEAAGFGTLWVGGSPSADLRVVEQMLAATTSLAVATGIVNVWASDPAEAAASFHRVEAAHPGRFVLGVGVGHPEATQEYRSPFDTLSSYVDDLLAAGVPREQLVLAALGPRVLRLSRDRTAGAHPYLTTPEHTRSAREILGDGPVLAPEHKVVLDTDPERAREIGRRTVDFYLGLSNYVSNLHRLGFTEADTASPGTDTLVDAVVAHGTDAEVAAQLTAHLDAGASHVAAQLLTADPDDLDEVSDGLRRLGAALHAT
ncbi:LLM class F420-dependent oxidoreductase [Jatrophihabitans sp. YIM 134969]